jgi:inhibitor of cysteine peptidase
MSVSPPDLELVDPPADQQIQIAPGAHLVVRLTENPTTGYRWHHALTSLGVIEWLEDEYVSASAARGSGGCRSVSFRALTPGSTIIQFALKRAWESKPPVQSLRISVDVEVAGAGHSGNAANS